MSDVTQILAAVGDGDPPSADRLMSLVYDDLRQMAMARLRNESPGQTIQITDLVHEAYLRLFRSGKPAFQNRAHFFGAAAEAMRRILVEQARRHHQAKRGGGRHRVNLDELPQTAATCQPDPVNVLAVHEALRQLEQVDPRAASIVKLRCFVGMSIANIAESLALSTRTVNRDWQVASAWLRRELEK